MKVIAKMTETKLFRSNFYTNVMDETTSHLFSREEHFQDLFGFLSKIQLVNTYSFIFYILKCVKTLHKIK